MSYNLHSVLVVVIAGGCAAQATGVLRGSLVDGATSLPLSGMTIVAYQVTVAASNGTRPFFAVARTEVSGNFSVPGLASGGYKIGVPNEGLLLDPCAWPAHSLVNVTTVPGQDIKLSLNSGFRVYVRFNGASELLVPNPGTVRPAVEAQALDDKGNIAHTFRVWQKDSTGVILSAVVPKDPSLKLFIGNSGLVLADRTNRLLASPGESQSMPQKPQQDLASTISRRFPGGGQISGDPTVLIQVTGRKSQAGTQ